MTGEILRRQKSRSTQANIGEPMNFFSDLQDCLNKSAFPTPDQLSDLSVRKTLAAVDEIRDAAENSVVGTFEKFAAVVSSGCCDCTAKPGRNRRGY
jgi:hypothetical protein